MSDARTNEQIESCPLTITRTHKCALVWGHTGPCREVLPSNPKSGLELALLFHETYERLAPEFGYETRKETRAFSPSSPNGQLMIAVCDYVLTILGRGGHETRAPRKRYFVRGRFIPISANGVMQTGLDPIPESTHEVEIVDSSARETKCARALSDIAAICPCPGHPFNCWHHPTGCACARKTNESPS